MAAGFNHTCDSCGYRVATSGLFEFFRDRQGRRLDAGHPVPCVEAMKAGIAGFTARVYCPDCDTGSEIVILEFPQPKQGLITAWVAAIGPEARGELRTARCPVCGGGNWVLGPEKRREVPCPRCKQGRLVGELAWMS